MVHEQDVLTARNFDKLGKGFSTLAKSEEALKPNSALKQSLGVTKDRLPGSQTWIANVVENEKELQEKLKFKLDLALPIPSWSVNIGTELSMQRHQNNKELIVLVHYRQESSKARFTQNLSIDDTLETLHAEDPENFYEQYGDSVISEVVYGKEFTAFIKITVVELSDKKNFKVSLDAAKGILTSALEHNKKLKNLKVNCETQFLARGHFNIEAITGMKTLGEIETWTQNILKQCKDSNSNEAIVSIKTNHYCEIQSQLKFRQDLKMNILYAKKYLDKMTEIHCRIKFLNKLLTHEDFNSKAEDKKLLNELDQQFATLITTLRNTTADKIPDYIESKKDLLKSTIATLNRILKENREINHIIPISMFKKKSKHEKFIKSKKSSDKKHGFSWNYQLLEKLEAAQSLALQANIHDKDKAAKERKTKRELTLCFGAKKSELFKTRLLAGGSELVVDGPVKDELKKGQLYLLSNTHKNYPNSQAKLTANYLSNEVQALTEQPISPKRKTLTS